MAETKLPGRIQEQLDGWYTDESVWPKDRTLKVFQQWFECRLHSVVLDTGSGRLSRL
jgi:hypothetical protein